MTWFFLAVIVFISLFYQQSTQDSDFTSSNSFFTAGSLGHERSRRRRRKGWTRSDLIVAELLKFFPLLFLLEWQFCSLYLPYPVSSPRAALFFIPSLVYLSFCGGNIGGEEIAEILEQRNKNQIRWDERQDRKRQEDEETVSQLFCHDFGCSCLFVSLSLLLLSFN
jgi:hypothetical protein